jgi:CMP/dCMP kinase
MPSNISSHRLVIAVDGPAASGKGTLGMRLARHFSLPHLDTGLLYRAVGRKYLMSGDDDPVVAIRAAETFHIAELAQPGLHNEEIGQAASIVSSIPEVRAALLKFQKDFAAQEKGAVLDGRDIGTIICPDATVKLYITASPEVRATRRFQQMKQSDPNVRYEAILDAIKTRDERDSSRSSAPMKAAPDARILDTSNLDIDGVFERALEIINEIIRS